jgi:hypothetical protein
MKHRDQPHLDDDERPDDLPQADAPDAVPDGDPQALLALIESEKARTQQALDPDPRLIFGVWGIAWLVGFLAFWSAASDEVAWDLPLGAAGAFFFLCLASAVVVTMVHVGRRAVGVRGVSSTTGAMYGWTWFLSFLTLTVIMASAINRGLPEELIGLLWSVLSGLVVGSLYLAGGAVWQDRFQFGLGVWILVCSAAGAIAGYPSVFLVMALAGGGGFLLAAAFFALRQGRFRA